MERDMRSPDVRWYADGHQRWIRCGGCGTKILRHPDEAPELTRYCSPCWRKLSAPVSR